MNCLMITLKDKRKFITKKQYLNQLLEFSRTFNATLSIVATNEKKPLSLDQLAKEICDTNYRNENFKYKIIKNLEKPKQDKNNIIFSSILQNIEKNKIFDSEKLVKKYKKKGIDAKNIYSQITKAKKHIKRIGMTLRKISKTQYEIN